MSGKLKIEKWDTAKDGPLNAENMEKKLKSQGFTFERFEYPPGKVFAEHAHGEFNKDSILSGQFKFTMYGETITLGPGDMVEIPNIAPHSCSVAGDQPCVLYDAMK